MYILCSCFIEIHTVFSISQGILEVIRYEHISSFPHLYTATLHCRVWMIPYTQST